MNEPPTSPHSATDPEPQNRPAVAKQTFLAELFGAVAPRTFLLVVGVLLIQLGFVFSYVGAFHHPTPHRVPVTIVAPAQLSNRLVGGFNAIHGQPLAATAVTTQSAAETLLRHGSTDGVLIISPTGTTDQLLVAGGGGAALSSAVQDVIGPAEAAQHRHVSVTDLVPAQSGDARGLSGFYLVIGWLVGGYLVAALLGIVSGGRPATSRRALIRLIVLVPYALVSGVLGAVIVGPVLGALTGNFIAIAALGALLVYCAVTVTMAFQVLLGTLGVGLTVILFVVLGNPSAGGAYQAPLLPGFWRAISGALPNGAGVDALRRIIYFGSYGTTGNIVVIALYTCAGIVIALAGAEILSRRVSAGEAAAAVV